MTKLYGAGGAPGADADMGSDAGASNSNGGAGPTVEEVD